MILALSGSEKNMSSAVDLRNVSEYCSAEIVSNLNYEKKMLKNVCILIIWGTINRGTF